MSRPHKFSEYTIDGSGMYYTQSAYGDTTDYIYVVRFDKLIHNVDEIDEYEMSKILSYVYDLGREAKAKEVKGVLGIWDR
jgi:hypothetical protein